MILMSGVVGELSSYDVSAAWCGVVESEAWDIDCN